MFDNLRRQTMEDKEEQERIAQESELYREIVRILNEIEEMLDEGRASRIIRLLREFIYQKLSKKKSLKKAV